jgi:hypothetical protein
MAQATNATSIGPANGDADGRAVAGTRFVRRLAWLALIV